MIRLTGVSRSYRMGASEVSALCSIDLSIEKGESVAIVGPSGSGKSTLMNIMGCLDRPTSGQYALAGTRVEELGDDELAAVRNRNIGFVFQTFNLLARHTALENVELPLLYAGVADPHRRASEALGQVGLEKRALHRPNELSGGERQRVAIARAIVLDPPVLLCDEPTGNLDSRTGEEIMRLLEGLNSKGSTLVLVTHDREIASRAGRIITIRDGRARP